MDLPEIKVVYRPRGKDDPKPYLAMAVWADKRYHAGEAASPSEAVLLMAAHWHSRVHTEPAA